ncbi:hypothetical protein GCM10009416_51120 [Craurococcus roseus]|uniref:Uncharacterized protein n=1 Tax=Craurococcus roseus TaxID=77585 RepID=A0ABP3RD01_9PROT
MRGAASALLLLAASLPPLLAGCGRAGPPRPPGPAGAITYPRIYPAPESAPVPPAPAAAVPQPAPPAGTAPPMRSLR